MVPEGRALHPEGIWDNGMVRIYPHRAAVVIDPYDVLEIDEALQQAICETLERDYPADASIVLLNPKSYSLTVKALEVFRRFATRRDCNVACVSAQPISSHFQEFADRMYFGGKLIGVFDDIDTACQVLRALTTTANQ